MITPWQIYWITAADRIQTFGTVIAVLAGATSFVSCAIACALTAQGDEMADPVKRIAKRVLAVFSVGLVISVVCPSKTDIAAMIVIPRIANSETVGELGDGVKTLVIEWMDELRPNKKNIPRKEKDHET